TTRFPYTTLFRSKGCRPPAPGGTVGHAGDRPPGLRFCRAAMGFDRRPVRLLLRRVVGDGPRDHRCFFLEKGDGGRGDCRRRHRRVAVERLGADVYNSTGLVIRRLWCGRPPPTITRTLVSIPSVRVTS